jgi:hypothetical protein
MVRDTTYNSINVTGSVDLANTILNVTSTRMNHAGDVVVLIRNNGTGSITGHFSNLPEGSALVANGVGYQVTYYYDAETGQSGTGNDVALINFFDSGTYQAIADEVTTTKNQVVYVNVFGNDIYGGFDLRPFILSVSVLTASGTTTTPIFGVGPANVTTPKGGTLSIDPYGLFHYTPPAGFVGNDGDNTPNNAILYLGSDLVTGASSASLQFVVSGPTIPTVTSLTPNVTIISDADVGTATFSLTAAYSEDMNQTVAPTITFPGHDLASTLSLNTSASGWISSTTCGT